MAGFKAIDSVFAVPEGLGVRLPQTMKRMYGIHDGGSVRDVFSGDGENPDDFDLSPDLSVASREQDAVFWDECDALFAPLTRVAR